MIDNQVKNVAALKKEITNRIFELCQQFGIVDKYLVYKAFDDVWEQISLDLEAIRLQGFDAARSVEDIEVYDKKEKKAVKKGEEGRVIPFALIQKHLFADEFTQMDGLNKDLSGATSEYESFWEGLDDELKEELKKKDDGDEQSEAKLDTKQLKAKYQEVLATLSNDTTKRKWSFKRATRNSFGRMKRKKSKTAPINNRRLMRLLSKSKTTSKSTRKKMIIRSVICTSSVSRFLL